jgi:hypothetical protein
MPPPTSAAPRGSRRCVIKAGVVSLREGRAGASGSLHLSYIEREGVEKDGSKGKLDSATRTSTERHSRPSCHLGARRHAELAPYATLSLPPTSGIRFGPQLARLQSSGSEGSGVRALIALGSPSQLGLGSAGTRDLGGHAPRYGALRLSVSRNLSSSAPICRRRRPIQPLPTSSPPRTRPFDARLILAWPLRWPPSMLALHDLDGAHSGSVARAMTSPTISPFIRDETPVDRAGDDRPRCPCRRDRDDSGRLEDLLISWGNGR